MTRKKAQIKGANNFIRFWANNPFMALKDFSCLNKKISTSIDIQLA
jgi:hypothetical protein